MEQLRDELDMVGASEASEVQVMPSFLGGEAREALLDKSGHFEEYYGG